MCEFLHEFEIVKILTQYY